MRLCWIALTALALVACNGEEPAPADPVAEDVAPAASVAIDDTPAATSTPLSTDLPIQRVESLMVSRLNDRASTVLILASGSVPSGGWSAAHLEPFESSDEVTIQTFRFLATSPDVETAELNSQTVEARLELPNLPPEIEMIRVVAETNALTAFVSD
jgi:hypothetical protein